MAEQTDPIHAKDSGANRRILYTPKSPGSVSAADFSLEHCEAPVARPGSFVLRPLFISIDPYMVRLLKGEGSYLGVGAGRPMRGRVIARVLSAGDGEAGGTDASPAGAQSSVKAGDAVLAECEWADLAAAAAEAVYKIDEASGIPLSAYLGVAGHSGITAWAGLIDIGQPKPGETVLVSAASGAVGSVVGQLARSRGCRAVGIAGGPDKVRHVVRDLGFDACVDYKAPDFIAQLRAAVPAGVDIYFENVGGMVFDAVLPHLNRYARIPLCGLISLYDGPPRPLTLQNFSALLDKTARLQAFRVHDYLNRRDEIVDELVSLIAAGKLHFRESIARGLENAPGALEAMMAGRNIGKQVVRV